jgi:hypothetical protein
MLSADREGKKPATTITSKRASQGQSMRSTSKGKSGAKEQRSSVTKKPFMQTSTAQQRKYSIFSSSGCSESDSDSPGYVDVSKENRRRHNREAA